MAGYFAHAAALVETESIGEGTRIWAFAHVMKDAIIGKSCNICDHAFIESNVVIGDGVTIKNGVAIWDGVTLGNHVFVGPNAVFTNDLNPRAEIKKGRQQFVATIVGEGATIGANATIVCGVTIGEYAFIGAGAVVTRSVPPYALVVGNPARRIGYMCRCGERLDESLICKCGLRLEVSSSGLRVIGPPEFAARL
ncbi:MAG TPA: acyltransferase [Terriglobales bacterium]|nr:acyltransferase [Terriglobales bacterium]